MYGLEKTSLTATILAKQQVYRRGGLNLSRLEIADRGDLELTNFTHMRGQPNTPLQAHRHDYIKSIAALFCFQQRTAVRVGQCDAGIRARERA